MRKQRISAFLAVMSLACCTSNCQERATKNPTATTDVQILTDTMGVNFEPYLLKCLERVRKNWYALIPQEARDPMKKRGDVGIQFAVMKDGKLTDLKVATTSDDAMLDRAAIGSIAASAPFDPLPKEFRGDRLGLSLHFHYNPEKPPSR